MTWRKFVRCAAVLGMLAWIATLSIVGILYYEDPPSHVGEFIRILVLTASYGVLAFLVFDDD